MCKACCITNAQLMLAIIVVVLLMTRAALRTLSLSPQKVEYHFTPPWISEKGTDKEDTKCSALENGQGQEQ